MHGAYRATPSFYQAGSASNMEAINFYLSKTNPILAHEFMKSRGVA